MVVTDDVSSADEEEEVMGALVMVFLALVVLMATLELDISLGGTGLATICVCE